jgi:hypothetical protein
MRGTTTTTTAFRFAIEKKEKESERAIELGLVTIVHRVMEMVLFIPMEMKGLSKSILSTLLVSHHSVILMDVVMLMITDN